MKISNDDCDEVKFVGKIIMNYAKKVKKKKKMKKKSRKKREMLFAVLLAFLY